MKIILFVLWAIAIIALSITIRNGYYDKVVKGSLIIKIIIVLVSIVILTFIEGMAW